VGTVIGFPHGASLTATKVFESHLALDDGASELDMVIDDPGAYTKPWNSHRNFALSDTGFLRYQQICSIRENQQFFTIRPGFAWDLPPKLKFHAKGRVTVGLGVHVTFGPDGVSTGGGGKIRAEFGISRWFHHDQPAAKDPDAGSR